MGQLKGKQWLPRDVAKLLYDTGWKEPRNLALMVATVGGESDYYSEAEGDQHPDGTIDEGMFQLSSIHMQAWGFDSLASFKTMAYDPTKAVSYARTLWETDKMNGGTGFGPWYAFSDGGYKRHLKGAIIGVANMLLVMEGLEPRARYI